MADQHLTDKQKEAIRRIRQRQEKINKAGGITEKKYTPPEYSDSEKKRLQERYDSIKERNVGQRNYQKKEKTIINTKRKKGYILFLLTIFIIMFAGTYYNYAYFYDGRTFFNQKRYRCNGYLIKIGLQEDTGYLYNIYKNGKELYVGYSETNPPEIELLGEDVTGDGIPNLVIETDDGGAHCFGYDKVFSLGEKFRLIETLYGGSFYDKNNDHIYEYSTLDFSFSYWNTSFAASPFPEVVLKYRNGKYIADKRLMEKPLPSINEERKIIKGIKEYNTYNSGEWDSVISPKVWGYMLDLMYTGHPEKAWEFLDEIWPKGISGKEQFIRDFKNQLQKSYWKDLESQYY